MQGRFDSLQREKRALERKLDDEITNNIQLCSEVDGLQWTKRNLQGVIEKIQSEHIEEIRKVIEKRL